MYLKIQELNSSLVVEAKKYFSSDYILDLSNKYTFNESLVARYLIAQNKLKYSCISHKKDLVFIGTSDYNIGVDIEVYQYRDKSVLDIFSDKEYYLLGGKNFNSFYILWTAKESMIKLLNINLDDMKSIKLITLKQKEKTIEDIIFNYEFLFKYEDKLIKVFSGKNNKYYFSICYF